MQQAVGNGRTGVGSQRCRADGPRARLLARPVALYPSPIQLFKHANVNSRSACSWLDVSGYHPMGMGNYGEDKNGQFHK